MKKITPLMTALGFLAGCGAPAHVPLDKGTTGEPVYPRSAISNPAILKVAGLIRELALRERTADGAELFSSCEILPPARSVLPYGVGQYEHETFIFAKTLDEFNFCKTAGKPYDMVVTASLIFAKKILGDALTIKSDGNWDDWDGGRLLYESTFDEIPTQEEVFA